MSEREYTKFFQVRLTPQQHEALKAESEKQGINMSDVARRIIFGMGNAQPIKIKESK